MSPKNNIPGLRALARAEALSHQNPYKNRLNELPIELKLKIYGLRQQLEKIDRLPKIYSNQKIMTSCYDPRFSMINNPLFYREFTTVWHLYEAHIPQHLRMLRRTYP